jgi:hypothetical protein
LRWELERTRKRRGRKMSERAKEEEEISENPTPK